MNSNYAEEKPVKFGETLTSNVEGNPEPSPGNGEGVESRQRVCIRCNKDIPSDKRKDAKFCSATCRNTTNAYRYAVKVGRIQKPGVGTGGNQLGKDNHMYKNGIKDYQKRAFAHYGKKCGRCGSTKNILAHHRDEDRTNNEIENLEVLCKRCHQEHHCTRDPITGKYTKRCSSPQ